MAQARPETTLSQTVVPGVLVENGGIEKHAEEIAGGVIGQSGGIALAVARRSLPVAGVLPIQLRPPCVPCGAHEIDGIDLLVNKEPEFLARVQRAWFEAVAVARQVDRGFLHPLRETRY